MTLSVPLSPETESKLRTRAAAEGEELSTYAARLLEQAVNRSDLDDLLEPLRQQFAASGDTDEQLIDHITQRAKPIEKSGERRRPEGCL